MNSNIYSGVFIFMLGAVFGVLLQLWREKSLRAGLDNEKGQILDAARKQAEAISRDARLAANEEALKVRAESEQLIAARSKENAIVEQRLLTREELVNGQLERLVKEETILRGDRQALAQKSAEIAELREQATRLVEQRRTELASVSRLSEQEVRAAFLKQVEQESTRDAVQLSQHVLEEAKVCAEEKARKIITLAIQRYAGHHSFETSTATVNIKGEEMKGRIIGREGRNIRAFEAETGVTVLIDDTPGAVVLSGFDPVRREVAREAMERLILDGRIHPARIEEVVSKVSQEMDQFIERAGEEAILKLGLAPMHIELIKLLVLPPFPQQFRAKHSPTLD